MSTDLQFNLKNQLRMLINQYMRTNDIAPFVRFVEDTAKLMKVEASTKEYYDKGVKEGRERTLRELKELVSKRKLNENKNMLNQIINEMRGLGEFLNSLSELVGRLG